MRVNIIRHFNIYHLPEKVRTGIDHFCGHYPIFYYKLLVVNIFQKDVQYFQPLLDAVFNFFPFFSTDDAWNNIKWKYFFNAFTAAINCKRDTLAHKKFL